MDDLVCRICFGTAYENNLGQLISPCMCSGSMRYAHLQCLNDWRSQSTNPRSFTHCDQCGYAYNIQRTHWAPILENPRIIKGIAYILLLIFTIISALLLTPLNTAHHFWKLVQWNPQLILSIWCWQLDFLVSGLIGVSVFGIGIAIRDTYHRNRFTNHTWILSIITPLMTDDVRIFRVFALFGVITAAKSVLQYSEHVAKILLTKWGTTILTR